MLPSSHHGQSDIPQFILYDRRRIIIICCQCTITIRYTFFFIHAIVVNTTMTQKMISFFFSHPLFFSRGIKEKEAFHDALWKEPILTWHKPPFFIKYVDCEFKSMIAQLDLITQSDDSLKNRLDFLFEKLTRGFRLAVKVTRVTNRVF